MNTRLIIAGLLFVVVSLGAMAIFNADLWRIIVPAAILSLVYYRAGGRDTTMRVCQRCGKANAVGTAKCVDCLEPMAGGR